jgi:large subunit ribosomal protein L17
MKHRTRGRILNRNMTHRRAMFRNMAISLFAHERIETTIAKAKELRPFAEKLVTVAKRGADALESAGDKTDAEKIARAEALNHRRILMSQLGGKKYVITKEDGKDVEINVVDKLLKEIGPRFKQRAGGYTRIVKLATRRRGDAAETAIIELLSANEPAKRKEKKSAPAPVIAE